LIQLDTHTPTETPRLFTAAARVSTQHPLSVSLCFPTTTTMVADKSKKLKLSDNTEEIDGELVLSVEKLQEIQDELEKVPKFSFLFLLLSISKN
jgi:hypothetical protein